MTETLYNVTEEWVTNAAVGGAVLGAGGGGAINEGIQAGRLSIEYGTPQIVPLSSLDESELIVTVSAVGAPGATNQYVEPADYVRAFGLVRDELERRDKPVAAIMTNEMGGTSTLNGLIQSSVTDVPLVDAACNGRAHPTGPMGAMGLPLNETVLQACVGGDANAGRHVEITVDATLEHAASTVRRGAETASGLVAVARNPVATEYVAKNAAIGVYEQAVSLGRAIRESPDGVDAAAQVAELLDGTIRTVGEVESVELKTQAGFDVGEVSIDGVALTFWNEYMTAELDSERVATFPDLIVTLDADSGRPVSTAKLRENQEIALVTAPAASLSLGTSMGRRELIEPIEETLDIPILRYAFDN